MAIQTSLEYFLGNDKAFDFTVYRDKSKSQIRDVSGYTLSFMLKRGKSDADGAALYSGSATVTGTYNIDPAANTQKAVAQLSDTDLPVSTTAGQVHWELKRTDAGSETVLAYGRMLLIRPVHDA
jgi:hypothetical protein